MRDWDDECNDIIQRRNNSTLVQLVALFLKGGGQLHPNNLDLQKKNKKKNTCTSFPKKMRDSLFPKSSKP